MGKHARAAKAIRARYAVKSGDEVRRKFAARMADLGRMVDVDTMEGATVASKGVKHALARLSEEMFEFKFGRPPVGNDPVFFDMDADTPQLMGTVRLSSIPMDDDEVMAELVEAGRKASVDPAKVVPSFAKDLREYKKRQQ